MKNTRGKYEGVGGMGDKWMKIFLNEFCASMAVRMINRKRHHKTIMEQAELLSQDWVA